MRTLLAATIVLASSLAGCSERDSSAGMVGVNLPEAADVAVAGVDRSTSPSVPLFERLAMEAAERPTDTPRAEAVLEALSAAGVSVVGARQYLAATVDASYCVGGQTAAGLHVAICEYPGAGEAAAGRLASLERFRDVAPGREIIVNRKTTLTLSNAGDKARASEQQARAARAFLDVGAT